MSTGAAILVADDQPTARRLIVNLLSAQPGWRVYAEAADGVEAVEIAKHSCPDVAVLDITMPRKNGLDAAKEILEFCPNVIIVTQSLHDEPIVVERLKQIGIKGYVHKLKLQSDLVPTVEAVLRGETRYSH